MTARSLADQPETCSAKLLRIEPCGFKGEPGSTIFQFKSARSSREVGDFQQKCRRTFSKTDDSLTQPSVLVGWGGKHDGSSRKVRDRRAKFGMIFEDRWLEVVSAAKQRDGRFQIAHRDDDHRDAFNLRWLFRSRHPQAARSLILD